MEIPNKSHPTWKSQKNHWMEFLAKEMLSTYAKLR
jgi:hypothetical protein